MKNKLAPIFTLAGLTLAAFTAEATSLVGGSADAGKAKALTCTACHGPAGNSANAVWPNIAGQNAPYIQAQLMAFKDGSRKDPLMSSQAMLLSEQDMADLAVYFESLPGASQSVANEKLLARGEPSTGVAISKTAQPLAWLAMDRPAAGIRRRSIRC